jgi:hypothetical protein
MSIKDYYQSRFEDKSKIKSEINNNIDNLNSEIDKWNNEPTVKKLGVKAIPQKELTDMEKKIKILKPLATVGIIALIAFSFMVFVIGVTIWKDGSLKPTVESICQPSINITIPSCPEPAPCNCNVNCDCPDKVGIDGNLSIKLENPIQINVSVIHNSTNSS